MARGTHETIADARNADVLIYVNGALVPRDEAKVSVFDSGFVLGDGVWEGVRLHNRKIAFLDQHLGRLFEGARAIAMDIGMTPDELTEALYRTVEANAMESNVHIRLMVTRGVKSTPHQDPRLTIGTATVVIIAEHKLKAPETDTVGVRLFTSSVRRAHPDTQDPKLNSHSKLNCITALVQALNAGADEALMLDPEGFVSTCNSTNFFIVRKGEVWTSTGKYCMNGITRGHVIEVARGDGSPVFEKDFSLTQVYGADEAFVTGTIGGLTPVAEVDGRAITGKLPGPVTARLKALLGELMDKECPAPSPARR
ncbi:MAG: aminotransferase class IV [Rhodospirillales bacterium]|jgi:branched-chain amino acid aminotransferase|nr:aminotransferase class IV [Rhodospirillales bacterium]MDP6803927.1 aminotransferase class IV [Rhodospirillales bacterium]